MNSDLVDKVLAGDFRSIARLISLVENDPLGAVPFMRALYRHTGRCVSIGITGAPGSGKSTLVDKLACLYRGQERKVGIIAVDPTSPFTGGAILGDRIRMQSRAPDDGTFIRSMATRGNLGGLARATGDALLVFDAAGFDIVLIETVGVGQDEVEIARTAQMTLVLLVPGMGDDVQAMKAGIMEIADVFVINKADHAGVERMEAELNALIGISGRRDVQRPEVVKTVASEGKGIEECARAIDAWIRRAKDSDTQREKMAQTQKELLLNLVRSEVQRSLYEDPRTARRLEELAHGVAERLVDPYSAAEELIQLWKSEGSIPPTEPRP